MSDVFWVWQLEQLLLLAAKVERLELNHREDAPAILERLKRVIGVFFYCLVTDWKGPKEG